VVSLSGCALQGCTKYYIFVKNNKLKLTGRDPELNQGLGIPRHFVSEHALRKSSIFYIILYEKLRKIPKEKKKGKIFNGL
jgi:hypothetical protein